MDREKPKPMQRQASILSTMSERHERVMWFFNDMRVYIVFDIVITFFWTAMMYFYWPMMTSIELQFQLNSKRMGFLNSCLEIGRIPLLLLLPFFGGRLHIPRLLGGMAIMRVVALVLLFLPHFLFGQRIVALLKSTMEGSTLTPEEELLYVGNFTYTTQICHPSADKLDIETLTEGLMDKSRIAYGMFIASYSLFGMSSVAGPTLGMAYFDNNFDKSKLPLLLGIMGAIMPLGPFMGSMLAIWMSRLYVDLSEVPITFYDPRWISAWWLGIVIVTVPIAIIGPLICFFPRRMRKKGTININIACINQWFGGKQNSDNANDGGEDIRKVKTQMSKEDKRQKEEQDKKEALEKEEVFRKRSAEAFTLKNYPKAFLRILKNPLFLLLLLDSVLTNFAWSGWSTFSMKYYEQIFRLPAWKVTTINTVARLIVGPLGSLCGGIIITRLRPTYARVSLLMIFNLLMYIGISVGRMFITCGDSNYAGFDYAGSSPLMGECNAECECGLEVYNPVCDNGMTYFSPCHAGCELANVTLTDGVVKPDYTDLYACNCTASGYAVFGKCEGECNLVYLYVALHSIGMFVWSLTGSVGFLLLIRAVGFHDKAFAIGISGFFSALLGSLPSGPVIGSIIDSTCRLFQMIRGEQAKCWIHDADQLRFRMYGWTLSFMTAQCFVFVAIYIISKKRNLKLFNEDDPTMLEVPAEIGDVNDVRKDENDKGDVNDVSKNENGKVNAHSVNFGQDKYMTDCDNRGYENSQDNAQISRL